MDRARLVSKMLLLSALLLGEESKILRVEEMEEEDLGDVVAEAPAGDENCLVGASF